MSCFKQSAPSSIQSLAHTTIKRTRISQRRVQMEHVTIRNPLQAPKKRSCGISITSPSLSSANRDLLNINQITPKEGTIEFFDIIEISPFEEIYEWCLIHQRNA